MFFINTRYGFSKKSTLLTKIFYHQTHQIREIDNFNAFHWYWEKKKQTQHNSNCVPQQKKKLIQSDIGDQRRKTKYETIMNSYEVVFAYWQGNIWIPYVVLSDILKCNHSGILEIFQTKFCSLFKSQYIIVLKITSYNILC